MYTISEANTQMANMSQLRWEYIDRPTNDLTPLSLPPNFLIFIYFPILVSHALFSLNANPKTKSP